MGNDLLSELLSRNPGENLKLKHVKMDKLFLPVPIRYQIKRVAWISEWIVFQCLLIVCAWILLSLEWNQRISQLSKTLWSNYGSQLNWGYKEFLWKSFFNLIDTFIQLTYRKNLLSCQPLPVLQIVVNEEGPTLLLCQLSPMSPSCPTFPGTTQLLEWHTELSLNS